MTLGFYQSILFLMEISQSFLTWKKGATASFSFNFEARSLRISGKLNIVQMRKMKITLENL